MNFVLNILLVQAQLICYNDTKVQINAVEVDVYELNLNSFWFQWKDNRHINISINTELPQYELIVSQLISK